MRSINTFSFSLALCATLTAPAIAAQCGNNANGFNAL